MKRPDRPNRTPPARRRARRSGAAQWAIFLVVLPFLCFGTLRGWTFLVHNHDDHELHIHGLPSCPVLAHGAHARAHGECCDSSHNSCPGDACTVPGGIVVSFPGQAAVSSRAAGRLLPQLAASLFVSIVPPPMSVCPEGPSHAALSAARLDVAGARGCERLVRTSCALTL